MEGMSVRARGRMEERIGEVKKGEREGEERRVKGMRMGGGGKDGRSECAGEGTMGEGIKKKEERG